MESYNLIWSHSGAQYTMSGVQASVHTVNGQILGAGQASFLDPF